MQAQPAQLRSVHQCFQLENNASIKSLSQHALDIKLLMHEMCDVTEEVS